MTSHPNDEPGTTREPISGAWADAQEREQNLARRRALDELDARIIAGNGPLRRYMQANAWKFPAFRHLTEPRR